MTEIIAIASLFTVSAAVWHFADRIPFIRMLAACDEMEESTKDLEPAWSAAPAGRNFESLRMAQNHAQRISRLRAPLPVTRVTCGR